MGVQVTAANQEFVGASELGDVMAMVLPVQQHQTPPAGHWVTDGGSGDHEQPGVVIEPGLEVGVSIQVRECGVRI
ncbi:hypothetical protein ACWGVR_10550 [Streptomyces xanthophaeus]